MFDVSDVPPFDLSLLFPFSLPLRLLLSLPLLLPLPFSLHTSLWEARSRPGCQDPQRSSTRDLSTTSWKMKSQGDQREDEEVEVNGDVEAIREAHNAHDHEDGMTRE